MNGSVVFGPTLATILKLCPGPGDSNPFPSFFDPNPTHGPRAARQGVPEAKQGAALPPARKWFPGPGDVYLSWVRDPIP